MKLIHPYDSAIKENEGFVPSISTRYEIKTFGEHWIIYDTQEKAYWGIHNNLCRYVNYAEAEDNLRFELLAVNKI